MFLTASIRGARDKTLDVLGLLEEVESPHSAPPTVSPLNLVDVFLLNNSLVDCASASMPLLARKKKKKKRKKSGRVWVYQYSSVCAGRTGQFRWSADCHKYVDCWRGQGTLRSCHPRSLVFNEATGQCDWPRNVPCITGDLEEEEEEEENVSPKLDLSRPRCEDYQALGYKCVEFWYCGEDGRILEDTSGYGIFTPRLQSSTSTQSSNTAFDPYSKTCPGEGEVCCRGSCLDDTRRKEAAAAQKAKPKSSSSSFCPGDFTGLRSVPGLCGKFVECYKGSPVVKDCPPGTVFCSVSLMCDWPSKAVCDQPDPVSTTPTTTSNTVSMTKSVSVVSSSHSVSDAPGLDARSGLGVQPPPPQSSTRVPSWSDVILARSGGLLPAPPSGQLVRLRQGQSPSEGYLQLYQDNRWGAVCDSGEWTLAEAAVVCRQLGFSRGVRRTTQGLVHGPVEGGERATERVECGGGEDGLEDCLTLPAGEGDTECRLEEDIVSVACLPDSWATCEEGEIPFRQSCYSFHPQPAPFHQAVGFCQRKGAVLVEIESQQENDMLSELLFQSSLLSGKMDHVWTGGVGSNIARKNVWFWHSDTEKVMNYRNFWKGWTGGDRIDRATLHSNQGIKLSRAFPYNPRGVRGTQKQQATDYYFWNLEDFSQQLGFICEKRQQDIGCVEVENTALSGLA